MRARMLVDAKVFREIVEGRPVDSDPDHPLKSFSEGQELEGADAEHQVALGNAEEIVDASSAPAEEVEVLATQAALDHAEAMGVDIAQIKGSGKDGKVLKSDVEAAVAAKEESASGGG